MRQIRRVALFSVFCTILVSISCRSSDGATIPADSPVAAALNKAEAAVQAIVALPADQRTFTNTIEAVDDLLTQLDTDVSMTLFMQHVSTDAKQREDGSRAEEDVSNWILELGKREDLYNAVKPIAMQKIKRQGEQQRLVDHIMRDYRRAGMELPADQREKLKQIQMEITKLGIEFEKNIREDETKVPMTKDELRGLPEDLLKNQLTSDSLCLVGMDYPSFNGVLEHCENEVARQKIWTAYKRRGGTKNVKLLERILQLRAQAASMLGYANVVDLETEIRMAKSSKTVREFYEKLRPLVREKARQDFEEYQAAKREHTGEAGAQLHPWDQMYYESHLKRTKYAVDSEKVREYFPMDRVVDGLFSITQSLYGLEYKDITSKAKSDGRPVWHEDVKLFEVWDKASGNMLGEFYIDLYPRENKYTHAAQWGLRQHKVFADGRVQKPLAALVCNFTKPTADKPSLLTHDEVETFFHEFGHCLHTIVSQAHYGRFAGTSVELDFVEAPSQMFENWVWDATVLNTFARHYQTGQPLPSELLEGMIKARYLGSGMAAEHQFYYGLTDYAYHSAPGGKVDTTKIATELFSQVELYAAPSNVFYQASFGHLVGYQAGYYGYMWSLVYAQDMFQRFKELGMLDPKAGMYYREKILARGGTMDGMDLVKDYLGREPKMDAFLEHLGLKAN